MLTVLHLPLVNLMIRREERQLEQSFGDAWREYAQGTRRWI
jgi:protein-S-isoprenylcysteine O-methyltransferase Ste14